MYFIFYLVKQAYQLYNMTKFTIIIMKKVHV